MKHDSKYLTNKLTRQIDGDERYTPMTNCSDKYIRLLLNYAVARNHEGNYPQHFYPKRLKDSFLYIELTKRYLDHGSIRIEGCHT